MVNYTSFFDISADYQKNLFERMLVHLKLT